jgi:hypothetical protein
MAGFTYREMQKLARKYKLYITRYCPGDGVCRYRFSLRDEDYFAGDGIHTLLGLKDAKNYFKGYTDCKTKVNRR